MTKDETNAEAAWERFNRPDFKEWTGDERLSLTAKTLIRFTWGPGTKYVLHDFQDDSKTYTPAVAERFVRGSEGFDYFRTYEALVKQETVEEEKGGTLYFLRSIIDREEILVVPVAQPIEIAQTMPEDS